MMTRSPISAFVIEHPAPMLQSRPMHTAGPMTAPAWSTVPAPISRRDIADPAVERGAGPRRSSGELRDLPQGEGRWTPEEPRIVHAPCPWPGSPSSEFGPAAEAERLGHVVFFLGQGDGVIDA